MTDRLFLSITSTIGSAFSFLYAIQFQNFIAWFIGIVAGIYSIYCSYLTHQEKKLQIKILKQQNGKK